MNQSRYTPVLMALRQSLVGASTPHCITTQRVKTGQLCQMSQREREREAQCNEGAVWKSDGVKEVRRDFPEGTILEQGFAGMNWGFN